MNCECGMMNTSPGVDGHVAAGRSPGGCEERIVGPGRGGGATVRVVLDVVGSRKSVLERVVKLQEAIRDRNRCDATPC
jgi:hypothetical protein